MRAFRPVEGGWSSSVDLRERSVLAQAATEAAEVILAGLGRGRRVLGIGLGFTASSPLPCKADGTPLVTAEKRGQGLVAQRHAGRGLAQRQDEVQAVELAGWEQAVAAAAAGRLQHQRLNSSFSLASGRVLGSQ